MGWQTDDGEHEGWDSVEFPGDRFSVGGQTGAVLVRHFPPRPGPLPDREGEPEVIQGRQGIGWRGLCECGWRGPLWERADSPGEHDFAARRIWSDDQYAPEGVADAIWEEWRAHLEPETLTAVREAATDVRAAQARLDAAVHEARRDIRSWADIGQAAGITRQAAHERWAKVTS